MSNLGSSTNIFGICLLTCVSFNIHWDITIALIYFLCTDRIIIFSWFLKPIFNSTEYLGWSLILGIINIHNGALVELISSIWDNNWITFFILCWNQKVNIFFKHIVCCELIFFETSILRYRFLTGRSFHDFSII